MMEIGRSGGRRGGLVDMFSRRSHWFLLCDTEREKERYEGNRSLRNKGFTSCVPECACSKAEWFCERARSCYAE